MAIKSVLGGDYTLGERTDEELIGLARSGGSRTGAWDELYRRHASSARSVARHLLRTRHDADDVVNEAFAGVISAIGHGSGPRDNFRQYLMACVRNGCKKRAWQGSTSISTDPAVLEQRHDTIYEDAEQFGEAGVVASAFSSLSTDWQRALWLTAVEERPTEEVAQQLGRRPGAVAALAYRAREAFAEAYLSQHQQRVTSPACERITPKLAHYVRGRSGDIDVARVEHHLTACADCTQAVVELRDVNASLRTLALPATLAGAGIAAAATMAPVVGLGAAVTIGGWSATVVSGLTFAKAALIAALLVPAVAIAAESNQNDERTITAAISPDPSAVRTSSDSASSDRASSDGSTFGESFFGGGAVSGSSFGGASAGPSASVTGSSAVPGTTSPTPMHSGVDAPAAGPASIVAPVVSVVASTAPPAITIPPATIQRPPVTTSPAAISPPGISIPPITVLPSIATPGITVLPALATPVIATPEIVVPPILGLPPIVVPPIVVPPITLPPIVLPPISLPAIVLPSISLPLPAAQPVLPKLTLPLPRLPDLLGNLLGN